MLFPSDVGLCTSGICSHLSVQSGGCWTANESHQPALQGGACIAPSRCNCSSAGQLQDNLSQGTFFKPVIISKWAATWVLHQHKMLPFLLGRMFHSLLATVKENIISNIDIDCVEVLCTKWERRISTGSRHAVQSVGMHCFREQLRALWITFLLWTAH